MTSLRKDYYQIPYDPNFNDLESSQFDSSGTRDGDRESDAILNFSWVHTFNSKLLLTVSPFYHYNSANYESSPNDYPTATTDQHSSSYAGGQVSFSANFSRTTCRSDSTDSIRTTTRTSASFPTARPMAILTLLRPIATRQPTAPFADQQSPTGGLAAFFIDDKFKPVSWLTLSAGMRPTHFSGGVSESAISPRFGVALNRPAPELDLPRLLRSLLSGASAHLHHRIARCSCARASAADSFRFPASATKRVSSASPFPSAAGSSTPTPSAPASTTSSITTSSENPISSSHSPSRTPSSAAGKPPCARRASLIVSRFTSPTPTRSPKEEAPLPVVSPISPRSIFGSLDHDQRNTLNVGGDVTLPWRAYASTNVYYGSGFSQRLSRSALSRRLPARTHHF